MKQFFIVLFILVSLTVRSQDLGRVDNKVRNYPQFTSAEAIANQINKDFDTDVEKVRAIYTWLALNIKYDLKALYNGQTAINFSYTDQQDLQRKLAAINTHTINKTLSTKKAVCEGYAQTFKRISELLDIPCLFIGGYSKTDINDIGNIPNQGNHAWNAVRINNKWYLIDVTWGAGYTNGNKWMPNFNDYYFFTNADEFLLSHLPTEPDLSFTGKKISKKAFYNTPIYSKNFFKNKLQLLSPLNGILSLKTNATIKVTFNKSAKNINLYYAFATNRLVKKADLICDEQKCSLNIPFTENKNTELVLFANKKTVLHYKIKIDN